MSAVNHGEYDSRMSENLFEDSGISPIEVVYRKELSIYVREAIEKLKKIHRDVLMLHDYSHKTIEEIATHEGIPEGTVKSRLFYARRELKKCLTQLFPRKICQTI